MTLFAENGTEDLFPVNHPTGAGAIGWPLVEIRTPTAFRHPSGKYTVPETIFRFPTECISRTGAFSGVFAGTVNEKKKLVTFDPFRTGDLVNQGRKIFFDFTPFFRDVGKDKSRDPDQNHGSADKIQS